MLSICQEINVFKLFYRDTLNPSLLIYAVEMHLEKRKLSNLQNIFLYFTAVVWHTAVKKK